VALFISGRSRRKTAPFFGFQRQQASIANAEMRYALSLHRLNLKTAVQPQIHADGRRYGGSCVPPLISPSGWMRRSELPTSAAPLHLRLSESICGFKI
jgi:hypothetical protein